MTAENDKQITWFEVNNLVPLIASAVMIALSWGALNSKVDLINQKLDTYIANQDKIIDKLADSLNIDEKEIATLKLQVNTLNVMHPKND